MSTQDRRQTANQALREQVDRIKRAHQRLKESAEMVERQALANVRRGHATVLPTSEIAQQHLRELCNQQKHALDELKRQVLTQDQQASKLAPLISAEEMNALLAQRDEL